MRKNKGSAHRIYVATSFLSDIFGEIERLSNDSGLGKAQVVRALFIRGLAAYYRDGQMSHAQDTKLVESTNLWVPDDDVNSTTAERLTLSVSPTLERTAQL